jgi:hypothetical protein
MSDTGTTIFSTKCFFISHEKQCKGSTNGKSTSTQRPVDAASGQYTTKRQEKTKTLTSITYIDDI